MHPGHRMQFVPARNAHVDSSGDGRRPVVTPRGERTMVYPGNARIPIPCQDEKKIRVVDGIVPR